MSLPTQTSTPLPYVLGPPVDELRKAFVGKRLDELRSPAFIIDRSIVARNCERMHERTEKAGMAFRAHVKTHKTAEVTRLQLVSPAGKWHAIVCSTMPELWGAARSGLVDEGVLNDILYGLPVPLDKLADLSSLSSEIASKGATFRILLDNPAQVRGLEAFAASHPGAVKWSAFIKVDGGGDRAGLPPRSEGMRELLKLALESAVLDVYGFYCHNGKSYTSPTPTVAGTFLTGELAAVNDAASIALSLSPSPPPKPYVLAIGSTPAAHAVLESTRPKTLNGTVELHAGNYPILDLQQLATRAVEMQDVAACVLTRVISVYPERKEAMCDAGAVAFSRDTGPSGGFGNVLSPPGWKVGRTSQEHGLLVHDPTASSSPPGELALGQTLKVVPQHACLTAAQFGWYYVVDGEDEVVKDVWVPWNGW